LSNPLSQTQTIDALPLEYEEQYSVILNDSQEIQLDTAQAL